MSDLGCKTCRRPTRVIDTRVVSPKNGSQYIRRRRECSEGHRQSTIEVIADLVRNNKPYFIESLDDNILLLKRDILELIDNTFGVGK